jgi:hypothetical protein
MKNFSDKHDDYSKKNHLMDMNMSIFKIPLDQIKTEHIECLHSFKNIDSSYLNYIPLYVSAVDYQLYGISLSVYNSLLENNIKEGMCIIIPGSYDEKFDIFLQNITTNNVLYYHIIRKKYPLENMVRECGFDRNQLDLLYSTDLDDASFDIQELDDHEIKMKKLYNITIVLKTLEDNYLIQKFFDTNQPEITYDYFRKKTNKSKNIFDEHFLQKKEDSFYKTHLYPKFIIVCENISELNEILKYFKLDKLGKKTTRINFKKIAKFFT